MIENKKKVGNKKKVMNSQVKIIKTNRVSKKFVNKPVSKSVNKNINNKNIINKEIIRVPIAAKLISILYFAFFVFFLLLGLLLLFSGFFFGVVGASVIESIPVLSVIGSIAGLIFIIIGIVFVLIGIMLLLVGIGLFRGRNWARIAVIIFSFIGVLMSVGGIMSFNILSILWSLFWLALDLVIAIYLIVSMDVKASFK
ncbi:hypothetical protein GOV12_05215 [Candidatus Pacearchaeota archaeon]|nr:hypothetical protein [Candidatus Pacearchaeota archaeon]